MQYGDEDDQTKDPDWVPDVDDLVEEDDEVTDYSGENWAVAAKAADDVEGTPIVVQNEDGSVVQTRCKKKKKKKGKWGRK